MLPRAVLLGLAGPTPDASSRAQDERIDELLSRLRGRKVKNAGPAPIDLQFPFKPAQLQPVADLAAADHRLGEARVEKLRDALLTPLRAYELVSSDGLRTFCFLSAWADEQGAVETAILRLVVPRRPKDWPTGAELQLDVYDEEDDALADALEQIAFDRIPSQRGLPDPDVPDPMRVLWVGGSTPELRDAAAGWRDRIDAFCAARGMRLERVLEQPGRRLAEAREEIHDFNGDVVVIWTPYCAGRADELQAARSGRVVRVDDRELSEALVEVEWALDDIAPASAPERGEMLPASRPAPGEVRYYKKCYGRRGGGDKMVRRGACNHSRWTGSSASSAPQAALGIGKLEHGAAWEKLEKCSVCTGGGLWRVTF